ncbi:thiamine pyrophosphate-binding protein [Lacisediminimonas profundi]|uniref:thiamine pyrophosphate-binding protein n=1 Tax=Lacisediminimonas profundi TaxID=2603856 RepID=UPI00124B5DCF|nr:thiamine pyrophosphate-binding protein [Lacisediminimonas profundi]
MAVNKLFEKNVSAGHGIGRVLEEAGIEMVFGIAGGHSGHIWAAMADYQDTIRTILVREESLASVMAEVYGRLTRRPGVVIGQGPWVLGNGLLGTIEAHLSSSPMLLLTDFSDTPGLSLHAPYQSGTGDYGGWDARRSFSGVTKQVMEAHRPAEAVHATQLAIKHALAGQPGPVAVLFSVSAFNGHVTTDSQPNLYPTQWYVPPQMLCVDEARLQAAVQALAAAKRPVIIAGNGVRIANAYEQLKRLAERADIPVVTTPSGKGVFAETDPRALGVFGTFGLPAANACVAQADLVLVIGSKLTASDTVRENTALLDPTRQVFIQVDVEPRNASWSFPAEHVLIGDAGHVLDRMAEGIGASGSGANRVAAYRAEHGYFNSPEYSSGSLPMLPQRIIAEMGKALPDDAIVTCDAGENRIFMMHFYQTRKAGGFLQAAGAGPMGYAIPSALAAKLVHPDRTVVAVCGDGGFSMTMNGLMTAIEHDIPIITVIFNNQMLGWSTHIRGPFAAQFHDFDHAAIARSMGCNGIKAYTPEEFSAALTEATASRVPTVIDVRISTEWSYQDVTSPLAS